jgi:SNF2 family DNA or RNA helicase
MTGTPTPQTVSSTGLKNLLGLVSFLQHDFFTRRLDGVNVWQNNVSRCWGNDEPAAFFRLQSLLSLLMVRHTKLDIKELPPPRFTKTFLSLSKDETIAYNNLASGIRANILLTSMKGKTSGHQDSLLNPSQGKHAKEAFRNLRLTCCGGTHVYPKLTDRLWRETIAMLQELGLEEYKIKIVQDYLRRAVTQQLSSCMRCGMQLSMLILMPCGDLICTECVNVSTRACPTCEKPFVVDQLQRLQPGFEYKWLLTIQEEAQARLDLKLGDVIYSRRRPGQRLTVNEDEDSSDVEQEDEGAMAGVDRAGHIPMQPFRLVRRTRLWNDGHKCKYDPASNDGICTLCHESHMVKVGCEFDEKTERCAICYKMAEICPKEETKFSYLTEKVLELRKQHRMSLARHASLSPGGRCVAPVNKDERPLKIIVFSQETRTLNLIGDRLVRRFGGACIAEFFSTERHQALSLFTKDPRCFCMTMSKDGSEGLDLSFVTHIFFLEEVWDKSLENQAVARAWRLGSKGRVEVETLIARDGVEESLAELSAGKRTVAEDADIALAASASSKRKQERAKLVYLLKTVRPIRGKWFGSVTLPSRSNKRVRNGDEGDSSAQQNSTEQKERRAKSSRVRFQL